MDKNKFNVRVVRVNNDGRVVSTDGSSVDQVREVIRDPDRLMNKKKLSTQAEMLISKFNPEQNRNNDPREEVAERRSRAKQQTFLPPPPIDRPFSRFSGRHVAIDQFSSLGSAAELFNFEEKLLNKRSEPRAAPKQKNRQESVFIDPLALSQISTSLIEPQLSDHDSSDDNNEADDTLDRFIETKLEEQLMETDHEANKVVQKTRALPVVKKRKYEDDVSESRSEAESSSSVFQSLSENTCEDISDAVMNCKELCFLVVFREGFTQLKDTSTLGSNFGSPEYIIVRIIKEDTEILFVKVRLWSKSFSEKLKSFFWDQFFIKASTRKLVFDGKTFLNCVLSAYPPGTKLPPTLRLIDPVVGCWLLRPDHPITTFSAAVTKLIPTSGVITGHLGHNSETCIVQQMEIMSTLCRELFKQLEAINTWQLFYQLEMRVLPALVMMERVGVDVDTEKLETLGQELERKMKTLEAEAVRISGRKFNLASPKQVREILFDELRLDQVSGVEVS